MSSFHYHLQNFETQYRTLAMYICEVFLINTLYDIIWIRFNVAGKALAHPRLKEPTAALYEQPIALDISNFETSSVFSKVRSVIFQNSSGVWKLNRPQVMYSWMHVPESPYVVIGTSTSTSHSVVWPSPSSTASTSANLAYHRLDLANPGQYRLCRNLRQLSSLGTQ